MQLLTNETKEALRLFPLYSTEDIYISNKVFICHFFNPCGAGNWYVCEGEPVDGSMPDDDWEFFGMVDLGMGQDWGYFRLSDLKGLSLPTGVGIQRDIHFKNKSAYSYVAPWALDGTRSRHETRSQ